MEQIRMRNLRSLRDTGYIDIKPLTILVGKNSSGKSTFLRFFPLMKQTLSTKKIEPILWYSKENVDFGSFHESINRKTSEGIIGFDFKFSFGFSRSIKKNEDALIPISLSVDLMKDSLKRVGFQLWGNEITLIKEDMKYILEINNEKADSYFFVPTPTVLEHFLPRFITQNSSNNESKESVTRNNSITEFYKEKLYEFTLNRSEDKEKTKFQSKLKSDVVKFSQSLTIRNMKSIVQKDKEALLKFEKELESQTIIFEQVYEESDDFPEENLASIELKEQNEVFKVIKNLSDNEYKKIINIFLGIYVDKIIDTSNDYLTSYFSQVHYIAPLRASAQRYYRLQGLAVDEIDPQGENIPMAINHLDPYQKKQFKQWMKQNFGFEIETTGKGGHVSLNISFEDNESLNLTDTGFGFSQILPILLLLWRVENDKNKVRLYRWMRFMNKHNIVIEQPELHLHPALQARLTDALVKCIMKTQERGIDLNIIIETHSETIINRVGQLIYKEKINEEIVNVLIFGDLESQNPSESSITSVGYNKEGAIKDWPLGFFYPEV